jgi:hypothetical protein
MNIQETHQVYANARRILENGVELHRVPLPASSNLGEALADLRDAIGRNQAGEEWLRYCNLISALYRLFLCSPVSFAAIMETRRDYLNDLNSKLKGSIKAFPQLEPFYKEVVSEAKLLINVSENPLAVAAREWYQGEEPRPSVVMVVPEAGLCEIGRSAVGKSASKWIVCPPAWVRQCEPTDCLVLFGPPSLLLRSGKGFVLRSPIAGRMINFCMGNAKISGFAPSSLNDSRMIKIDEKRSPRFQGRQLEWNIDELLPVDRDWAGLLNGAPLRTGNHGNGDLIVDCRPVILGGGFIVPLDITSKRWTLVWARKGGSVKCAGITRTDTIELSPGDLIVLTTEGSGDLLRPYADKVLGREAKGVNQLQEEWKNGLREHVAQHGMSATVDALKKLGCEIATATNIQNWYSEHQIAVRNLERDLGAVLNLIGLASRKLQVFQAVRKLYKARDAASALLHNSLIDRLEGVNLTEVLEEGFMEIKRDEGGPAKTVYIIEEIRHEIMSLPAHRVNRVRRIEEVST